MTEPPFIASESPKQEEGFVVETSLPDSCPTPNAFGDAVLQMALRMASGMEEPVDLESALTSSETSLSQDANAVEENGSYLRSQGRNQKRSNSRGRGRGRKRARTDEGPLDQSIGTETASSTPQAQPPPPTTTPPVPSLATQFDFRPIGPPQLESNCVLKVNCYCYQSMRYFGSNFYNCCFFLLSYSTPMG